MEPAEQLPAGFLEDQPDRPVVMLNLLRFAEGGRTLYQQYTKAFGETLAGRYGIEVVYAGDGGDPLVTDSAEQWDAVLLVRYPDRHTFLRMIEDPDYRRIAHLRKQALRATVLQPTRQWGRLA
ncbi:DUF1330 domain-containing protein [Paractinoplanes atraurantiacus]|uniref:DUF1330 domain-containing protein n=1 Tax=Paractinoplanes atraurantiacus TaxID=1036182 RepID=A0A285GQD0_9ACTN|nr:DUF1330 domain-containing protein [Actinoplanes atraurantiacus]SNY25434.1 protein of unknown function [Actinoplanes atraurantiacus]